MATPHVTGAIALYAASNPAAPRPLRTTSRPRRRLTNKLLGTKVATSSLSCRTATGGRLDVGKAPGRFDERRIAHHAGRPTQPGRRRGVGQRCRPDLAGRQQRQRGGVPHDVSTDGGQHLHDGRVGEGERLRVRELVGSRGCRPRRITRSGCSPTIPRACRPRATRRTPGPSTWSSRSPPTEGCEDPTEPWPGFEGHPGSWAVRAESVGSANDVPQQTLTADGLSRRKKCVAERDFDGDATEIYARVRVDWWRDGEYARGGVGPRTDPATGYGYNSSSRGGHFDGSIYAVSSSTTWAAWSGPGAAGPDQVRVGPEQALVLVPPEARRRGAVRQRLGGRLRAPSRRPG